MIATVIDLDSANFDTGTLTVSFVTGGDNAEDVLADPQSRQIRGRPDRGLRQYSDLWRDDNRHSPGGSGGSNLVVTFNGNATHAAAGADSATSPMRIRIRTIPPPGPEPYASS